MKADWLMGYAHLAQWIAEEQPGRPARFTPAPIRFSEEEQAKRRRLDVEPKGELAPFKIGDRVHAVSGGGNDWGVGTIIEHDPGRGFEWRVRLKSGVPFWMAPTELTLIQGAAEAAETGVWIERGADRRTPAPWKLVAVRFADGAECSGVPASCLNWSQSARPSATIVAYKVVS